MEVNDMKYFPRNLDVFDDMFDGFFTKEPVYNNPIMRTDVYEKNGFKAVEEKECSYTEDGKKIIHMLRG